MTSPEQHSVLPAAGRQGGRLGLTGAMATIVGVFVLIGIAVGVVWPQLVAQPKMLMIRDIGVQPVSEDDAAKLITMDGWYALLGMSACVVAGASLYVVFRRFGGWTVLAQFVGAGLAAFIAVVVGTVIGNNEVILAWQPDAEVGSTLQAPVALHSYGVMALWAIAAVLPVLPLILLLWLGDREERDSTIQN